LIIDTPLAITALLISCIAMIRLSPAIASAEATADYRCTSRVRQPASVPQCAIGIAVPKTVP